MGCVYYIQFFKFLILNFCLFVLQCVELIQGLLEHGRLTLKQMFDRAKSSEKEGKSDELLVEGAFVLKHLTQVISIF